MTYANKVILPEGWQVVELKSLVDRKRKISYGIVQPGEHCNGGVILVRGKDYSFGWVDVDEFFRVTPEIDHPYRRSKLKANDVLITIVGAGTGNVAIVPTWLEGANITQTTARVAIDRSNGSHTYFEYYLESSFGKREVYRFIKGGAQPGLNISDLERFHIILPPILEREKIAAILKCWSQSIDLTVRLIAAKQVRRIWLMQQLLSGKRRLPGFGNAWQTVQLGDIFERIQRRIPEGESPEVLSITAKVGFVSQREKFSKVIAGKNLENYVLIRRGEFSYNKGNSLTYPQGCIFRLKEFDEGAVPSVFYSFRAASPEVCPDFYSQFFSSGGLNHQLSRVINSGVRNDGLLNLNARDFFALKVPLPPKGEQERIAGILTDANREIDLLRAQLDALREQKKGLMQQLLTGKVRVKVTTQ